MRSSIVLLSVSSFLLGCGPAAAATPDAPPIAADAPEPCDAASFARTLIDAELRQATAPDPLADAGDCHHYRGSIAVLEVDEAACTMSGRFGYSGMATGGPVIAGSSPFTCTLRGSAPTGVYCVAGDLGTLGGRVLGMTFSDSETDDPMLTMTLTDEDGSGSISCIDVAEPAP